MARAIVNETTYKLDFINKHDCDYQIITEDLDQYGTYRKTYIFDDGAEMYEVNDIVTESQEITFKVKGIKFTKTVDVKLNRTELWNSDDAKSVFFYQPIFGGVEMRK